MTVPFNSGPSAAVSNNTQTAVNTHLSGAGTFANLPPADRHAPTNGIFVTAYTTDIGPVYSNGVSWISLGGAASASTWALRGTGTADGQVIRITDVGPGAGILVMWDATALIWRLTAPVALLGICTIQNGAATAAEQIMGQARLRAGLMASGRYFSLRALAGSNNGAENIDHRWRMGTAGTSADLEIFKVTSSSRSVTSGTWYARQTATQVNRITKLDGSSEWTLAGVGDAIPLSFTTSNSDTNDIFLTYSMQPATGTSTPITQALIMTLYP